MLFLWQAKSGGIEKFSDILEIFCSTTKTFWVSLSKSISGRICFRLCFSRAYSQCLFTNLITKILFLKHQLLGIRILEAQ